MKKLKFPKVLILIILIISVLTMHNISATSEYSETFVINSDSTEFTYILDSSLGEETIFDLKLNLIDYSSNVVNFSYRVPDLLTVEKSDAIITNNSNGWWIVNGSISNNLVVIINHEIVECVGDQVMSFYIEFFIEENSTAQVNLDWIKRTSFNV